MATVAPEDTGVGRFLSSDKMEEIQELITRIYIRLARARVVAAQFLSFHLPAEAQNQAVATIYQKYSSLKMFCSVRGRYPLLSGQLGLGVPNVVRTRLRS